jgi:chromosome segregation ATPase
MALLVHGLEHSSHHAPRPLRTGSASDSAVIHAVRVAVVIAAISGAVVAVADPAAGGDLNADKRALVAQLTAERAITLARERRLADAALEELSRRLAAQDLARRAAEAKAADNAAALRQARKARGEIARQREELVAALEQRDRTLAAEVQAYREEVTKLAASPDPEKQKALQLFADGEHTKALAVLDAIADAKRAAHDKAVQISDAAERRPTAWLAVQAHDVGDATLDQLVGRFE